MDARSWPRIRELLERALDVPPEQRRRFVESESHDADVRGEVLRLIASASTGFEVLRPPGEFQWRERFTARHPSPGERIGSFVIERVLGSGGMGTVYEARQERPARVVALKMMHSVLLTDDARRRFEIEAEILARLRHPNIATIHELGAHRGADGTEAPFFAMEFVEGARDIVTFARERELALRERIELFREVCAAVQYAHQKGVIHRDLKPGNVLVDSSGRPKVIDYGVARVVEADFASSVQTRAGELFGTLQYMSPEQLAGASRDLDTQSDVYSLGVILYELVAGRTAHDLAGHSIAEVIAQICERAPQPPSRHAPSVPRELDWIALRALAKDRGQRYASAAELSDDLARFLRNEPVLAGPPTWSYRAAKFVRRNRVLVAAGAAVVLSLVVGLAFALEARSVADARRKDADEARKTAESRRVEAETARARATQDAETARVALRRQTAVLGAMDRLFSSVQPNQDGRRVTLFELLERERERASGEFHDDPALRSRWLAHLGAAYDALGLHAEGESLLETAIEILEPVPDADVSGLAWLRANLGKMRTHQGRIAEARKLFEASLPVLEQLNELQTEHGVSVRRMYADLLEQLGDTLAAADELQSAAELAERVYGADHHETIHAKSQLASTLSTMRRYTEAESFARGAHERSLALVAPNHPQALYTGMTLAEVLRACGKLDESETLLRGVLDGALDLYGELNYNVVHAYEALAWTLAREGKFDEAGQLADEALRLALEHHGNNVMIEAWARICLADVFTARGDWRSRREQFALAVESIENASGSSSPAWWDVSCRLAWSDIALHDYGEAAQRVRALIDRAQAQSRRGSALHHAHGLLGIALAAGGDADAAAPELRACLEGYGALEDAELSTCSDELFDVLAEVCRQGARPDLAARFTAARQGRLSATPVSPGR